MNDVNAISEAVRQEVEGLTAHVVQLLGNMGVGEGQGFTTIDEVSHYVIVGRHVDPEWGVDYVPMNQPVSTYGRRKIGQRNTRVRKLVEWIVDAFEQGVRSDQIASELRQRQRYQVVGFGMGRAGLASIIADAMRKGYLYAEPGNLGDVQVVRRRDGGLLLGWEEMLSCEGGVTDRYRA